MYILVLCLTFRNFVSGQRYNKKTKNPILSNFGWFSKISSMHKSQMTGIQRSKFSENIQNKNMFVIEDEKMCLLVTAGHQWRFCVFDVGYFFNCKFFFWTPYIKQKNVNFKYFLMFVKQSTSMRFSSINNLHFVFSTDSTASVPYAYCCEVYEYLIRMHWFAQMT